MIIKKVALTAFRNFEKKSFDFSPKATFVVGPNASGKTNLLESICLLATGKSFKARVEEEMISYDAEIGRVKGRVVSNESSNGDGGVVLEGVLTRGEIDVGTDRSEKVARKRFLINGVGKRLIDFAGNFKVVLFGPWDLELVTESPSIRRKFLDTVLSQVDREYRRAILSYEKGLRQRNRLLWQIREDPSITSGRMRLLFWDKLLVKNGDYISQQRGRFIEFINAGNFQFSTPMSPKFSNFQLEYDRSAISEARLEQYANEEVAAATTLVGPHRDDFLFRVKGRESKRVKDLSRFGSRGEQRMGVLWLKLAELAFVEDKTDEKPTLLLDDIFSELDYEHRNIVMDVVRNQQTIITTADPHFVKSLGKLDTIDLGK